MRFSQNHAGTDVFFKNDARKLKFGPEVPLISIYKSMGQIFEFLTPPLACVTDLVMLNYDVIINKKVSFPVLVGLFKMTDQ